MPTQSTNTTLHLAIQTYGKEHQLKKAIEEMGECIAAIMQYMDGRPNSADKVCEEAADAVITLEQVRLIMGAKQFDEYFRKKIARLAKNTKQIIAQRDKKNDNK